MVIIEAVIDRQGNATEARVLEPLPLGVNQCALSAVRRGKLRPGALTANFRIE